MPVAAEPGEWADRAACRARQLPPDLFFPSSHAETEWALVVIRPVCADCPVFAACHAWAVAHEHEGTLALLEGDGR